MTTPLLATRKVAILVESEFVPEELAAYCKHFAAHGAEVLFVSRLWGQSEIAFLSDVTEPGKTPETLTVSVDLETIDPGDYAAVIMAANYTSCRLRYFETPEGETVSGDGARTPPAVRFIRRAMMNPAIVKGFLCHGLWILTPMPELLAGRRVICHEVVLADVVNAGAVYTPSETGVVIDDDMVTGRSYKEAGALADAIAKQVVARQSRPSRTPARVAAPTQGTRRVLVVLSGYGYWGEELVGPMHCYDRAGYQVDVCTPTGRRPPAITVSMDPDYIDPPLGRSVTSPEMAALVHAFDDPGHPQGQRLEDPIDLSAWVPERPYWSAPQMMRAMERYRADLEAFEADLAVYDGLCLVGGSGPIVDMVNNQRVHDLILGFVRADKPVAAICYGVACLAFARNTEDRRSILAGKRVTGHCLEYDYKDGTGFMSGRGTWVDFNMGPPPYPLEYILRDATAPDGAFIGNFGHPTSVIVDWPFVTGRSTPDAYLMGEKHVAMIDGNPPLRRWGW